MTVDGGLDSNQVSNLSNRWIRDLTPESSIPGESPPPPPRTFFGRDELIEKIVDLAENLIPIALIGAGGIGKTSIALAVLHHDRIKQRFGHHRRFIRCDKFPASSTHLLRRISNTIGAEVENPENLTPLRMFLSSRKMVIVLDNAESILDTQGADARRIYAVVEELSRFDNIWLCITSRISTIPPGCKCFDVPTLSKDTACDTFYGIYDSGDRSDLVNPILEQLDFHPLSITLLATVGHQNKWDMGRLTREWEQRRTSVLRTQYSNSLGATIELSLASPMFQELGPDARALLEIVAFFPQGVDENNLKWLPSTISNGTDIFDKFCILSLVHRSNGFFTMLAPLRDYLSPKDPMASPLLCTIKDLYFARLSVDIRPEANFEESRWITSDDVNVEHLLDVFTTFDANSEGVWDACHNFMEHLYWHKRRLTILKPKIEGLPDDHQSKPDCLFILAKLFDSVGNWVEQKRLLSRVLDIWRERESDYGVARVLTALSDTNQVIGLHEEGIQQAREALGIYERLGDTGQQANCLILLALLLNSEKQFDAAEEAAFRAIALIPEEGQQYRVCHSHIALSEIYQSKGEIEKAVHHTEVVLAIATPFNWNNGLFCAHFRLAQLFRRKGKFDDAQAHIEHAKTHAVDDMAYNLGGAMEEQARIWYMQRKLEEVRTEVLRAADVYSEIGAAKDVERCRELLRAMEEELNTASGQSGFNCELLRVLTLRSKFREASDSIDGCVKFFKFIFLQIARTLFLHLPFPCMATFSSNNAPPSSCLFHSRTFILFLVLPFVVESFPVSCFMYH